MQNGWRTFLVKVHNEAGVTAALRVSSPQAQKFLRPSSGSPEPKQNISAADVRDRWLELAVLDKQPLLPTLSGLPLEYRLIQLYSRDAVSAKQRWHLMLAKARRISAFATKHPYSSSAIQPKKFDCRFAMSMDRQLLPRC